MADIGLRYPVFAPVATEVAASALTYGTPVELKDAIAANLTWARSTAMLDASDRVAESDNGVASGTLSFNLSYLSPADKAALLGYAASGDDKIITDASAPYGGFGYVQVKQVTTGSTKRRFYVGNWIYKVQFSLNTQEAKTKPSGGIEWGTPTMEGRVFATYQDSTGVAQYAIESEEFTTYADAEAWVKVLAGLPVSTVATPAADPVAGAVAAETDVALTCATSGATIYYTTDGSTPTTGSMIYSAPITVYAAMTIKAIAAKAGMTNSAVLSAAYTISG